MFERAPENVLDDEHAPGGTEHHAFGAQRPVADVGAARLKRGDDRRHLAKQEEDAARVNEPPFVLGRLQHLGQAPALGDVRHHREASIGAWKPADAPYAGGGAVLEPRQLLRAGLQVALEGRIAGEIGPKTKDLEVPTGAISDHDAIPESVEEAGGCDGCAGHGSAPFNCTGTRRDNKTARKPARMKPAESRV